MRWPQAIYQRRKFRQDVSAFSALIATPGTGAFSLPANARLFFMSVAGCVAGTDAGTVGDRTIETPELEAGGRVEAGWIERGVEVTPALGFEVHIDIGLGRFAKVGEGV